MRVSAELALQLGGDALPNGNVLCPGPGHSAADRSLSVRRRGPDDFLVHSFAGDDPIVCLNYVRDKLGVARPDSARRMARDWVDRAPDPKPRAKPVDKGRSLWARKGPPKDSIVEHYLREARGYQGPMPTSLGFLAASQPHYPALIAAFAIPDEPEPGVLAVPSYVNAVHLILLKPDGSGKADTRPQKLTVGSPAGLPIVVAPVNDGLGLAICEGVEDAVSVYEATGLGVWAAGGASFMPKLAASVPGYVECVTIFAHDDNGKQGALALAEAVAMRRIEVRIEGLD